MKYAARRASAPKRITGKGFAVFASGTLLTASLAAMPDEACAHGTAGKRFFPATIATEDPFVADELSIPTFSSFREPASGEEPSARELETSFEFAKRITPNFGMSIEGAYITLQPDGLPTQRGWGNFELGLKYQFYSSAEHEAILSAGLGWEMGGTGTRRVEADSFSTIEPALFFGKGFGDMFDDQPLLKPLAVTGSIGIAFPTKASTTTFAVDEETEEFSAEVERHPNVLNIGLTIEYSLPYLQSFVKDVGLREPFNRIIPLVEISIQNPLNRGQSGQTTGTVNPGFLWAGRQFQFGLEAIIPINNRTGNQVGVLAQFHLYLDDISPQGLGRPLFGN
ncbi:MAG TPA: hypothetical protein VF104_06200 [Burkholderiales bacterium]